MAEIASIATAAFAGLVIFLIAGGTVATGLLTLFGASSITWVLLIAFIVFYVASR